MYDRLEDRIRDYLAAHLAVIEAGLSLLHTEYEMPGAFGAGGRLDIVARDAFGHVVIIEIKRSNQAARQAVTEICKYVALFRIQQGLGEKNIRVIVVSTEWHELLLPLSEFAETSEYLVEGVHIDIMNDGTVTHATRISMIPRIGEIRMSRMQAIYLFEDAARRNEAIPSVARVAEECGVVDYVIINCNYSGGCDAVTYPYAAYFCFSSPVHNLAPADAKKCTSRIEWDESLDDLDENFLVAMNESRGIICDSFEIGYPEKLTNIEYQWDISIAKRSGRFDGKASLLRDSDILALAKKVDGGSDCYLSKVTSPRFPAWKQLNQDMKLVLNGNTLWKKAIPLLLNEIESRWPNANVTVQVYVPANLLMSLYFMTRQGGFSHCPRLEVIVDDADSETIYWFLGFLVWSGRSISLTPEEVVENTFGGADQWMMANQLGGSFEYEDKAMRAHDLRPALVEWQLSRKGEVGPVSIATKAGALVRRRFDERRSKSLQEFAATQQRYLQALKLWLETIIWWPSR